MCSSFPDKPCMKRVYRKRRRPTASSQEQRALTVPRLRKPLVNRSLCFFIVLHRISLVRASGKPETCLRCLGSTRDACLLGALFCRRPVLPGPAPPLRRAPRPDPLAVCPGFGLEKSAYLKCCWIPFSTNRQNNYLR